LGCAGATPPPLPHPNTGSAQDLACLLARLQKGQVLPPTLLRTLLGYMERAVTGLRRLHSDLPSDTPVAGTGGAGAATNDVGIITLPRGGGHLAMGVLLSRSKRQASPSQISEELGRTHGRRQQQGQHPKRAPAKRVRGDQRQNQLPGGGHGCGGVPPVRRWTARLLSQALSKRGCRRRRRKDPRRRPRWCPSSRRGSRDTGPARPSRLIGLSGGGAPR
jgi:hypothetical protein